jgi:uncharacterized protein
MKIAVLSDIHDHIDNLDSALEKVKKTGSEAIIFCGDFCSPFVIPHLLLPGLHIYAFLGNNDGDPLAISEMAKPDQMEISSPGREYGEIDLDNTKIAYCHYPKTGRLLAQSNQYQVVFHGHTHQAYEEHLGNTLLANPGSICGIISGKYGPASFGVYDTASHKFELVYLFK